MDATPIVVTMITVGLTLVFAVAGAAWRVGMRVGAVEGGVKGCDNRLRALHIDVRDQGERLHTDIQSVRTEVKAGNESLRTEVKDNAQLVRTEVQDLRTEVKADVQLVRTEVSDLRTEVKSDIQVRDLRTEVKSRHPGPPVRDQDRHQRPSHRRQGPTCRNCAPKCMPTSASSDPRFVKPTTNSTESSSGSHRRWDSEVPRLAPLAFLTRPDGPRLSPSGQAAARGTATYPGS